MKKLLVASVKTRKVTVNRNPSVLSSQRHTDTHGVCDSVRDLADWQWRIPPSAETKTEKENSYKPHHEYLQANIAEILPKSLKSLINSVIFSHIFLHYS